MRQFPPGQPPYGQLVTNPPYGERLLERQEAEALYRAFGKMWERLPGGWRTLVLSAATRSSSAPSASQAKNQSASLA